MKKIKVKLIALVLAFACAFSFVACDSAKSAYEIAVKNGFRGTEAEWLQSLNGTNGKDGKDGEAITIDDLYEAAKADGFEGSMSDFIKEYLGSNAQLPDEEEAVNKTLFSVCDVVSKFKTKDQQTYFGTIPGETRTSYGAGVVYSLNKSTGDALVITNYHVVYDSDSAKSDGIADEIKLYFYGYEYTNVSTDYGVAANYVGGSMTYDIAVLSINNSDLLKTSDVTAAAINESDRLKVGSPAIAVGNPEGTGIAASSGIVSVDSEYIAMVAADDKTTISYRCIRVDCAINPGNSGGGLFDSCGRLIGIVNAKVVSDNVDNIGYAIPVSLVTKVADNIIRNADRGGKGVYSGRMGITVKSLSTKAVYDKATQSAIILEEVAVDAVSGTEAKKYLKEGDVILSIAKNGGEAKTVERRYDVTDFMLTTSVGDTVTLTVKRTDSGTENTLSFDFVLTQDNFVSVA